jgi:hypothetical protein
MKMLAIGLVAVGCWALAAIVGWALAKAGAIPPDPPRYQEPEDGIQGADPYSVTLASGGDIVFIEDATYTIHD